MNIYLVIFPLLRLVSTWQKKVAQNAKALQISILFLLDIFRRKQVGMIHACSTKHFSLKLIRQVEVRHVIEKLTGGQ